MNLRPIWLCVAAFRQFYLNIKFMFQRIFKTRSNIFIKQKKLKTILCPVLILADTGDFIKRERSTLKKKVLFQQYDQLTKQYL